MPTIARWKHRHADDAGIAVISVGARGTIAEEAEKHGLGLALEDPDLSLYKAYGIAGTPGAVLIAADGTIASPARSGAEGVEAVLEEALSLSEEDEGLPLGTPAPELRLSGVNGAEVDLAAFRGDETVVLFWDPACGFCRQMREELRALESGPRRLFVVSSGDREETRNEGFTCAVGLDQELIAGNLFAASGTPIAVLVNANGQIGSPPSVGSEEVLRLLRRGSSAASH